MLRSSCLCGGIVWEFNAEILFFSHCHCSMCRKSHGVGYASYAGVAGEGFRFASGEELIGRYESSPGAIRCFCSRCGSKVPTAPAEEQIFLPAGNFDGDPGARPEQHIFVGSKAPWVTIHDDLPQYDALPPGVPGPSFETREPAERQREGSARGSCLCGGAAFEIVGDARAIVQCHCSRCRKGRSAAHGANLFYADAELSWIRGAELRRHFKVPDARLFMNTFCQKCGSLLPRDVIPGQVRGVPAGCLDDDPGIRPGMHIFVDSKARWVQIADDLPQHEGRPGAL
jgi:hypothetical protein